MRLLMWSNLEHKTVNRLERGVIHTSIMTLATAWTEKNPFGPSHDPEAAKDPDVLRESIARTVALMTKADRSLS